MLNNLILLKRHCFLQTLSEILTFLNYKELLILINVTKLRVDTIK